ncbi:DUF7543 family protein [Halobacterium litoreum]|uniref:Uncharacterized protein n=1 Tax=Halobacterium litoreum TaxID=2039234 RepID=A0ABD5NHJ2_9EURY|nr:hypothetical protein [Halobacterium litoreum]UHH12305.1 hypothetical protein LT972_09055 [Halobacterium litoreum]
MNWAEVERRDGREWEREDGYAVVRMRQTARGDWAVTYDRLEQADEGSAYERVTVGSEDAALSRVERFRERATAES